MAKTNVLRASFLGGLASPDAYGRVDIERMASTSEVAVNIDTRVLGSFSIRPGFEHLYALAGTQKRVMETFAASKSDAAIIQFSDLALEVEADSGVITRPAVSCTVADGDFVSLAGWTIEASTGASAISNNAMLRMRAKARGSEVKAKQLVTTGSPGVEHALRIVVKLGEVQFSVGSTEGGSDLIRSATLTPGEHSLAFTPAGSFWIQFSTQQERYCDVDSCQIEPAGVMRLATPWPTSALGEIRTAQSIDVMFVACRGYWQQRIERRGPRSWSVVSYFADDGPFTIGRTAPIRLRSDDLTGNSRLHADASFFKPEHVGALFRLFHSGQRVETDLAGADEYSDSLRITGVGSDRQYTFGVTGVYTGTISPQRSTDGEFSGFVTSTYGNSEVGAAQDNTIAWRRQGFLPGSYTSGIAHVSLSFEGGGGYGICRVSNFISDTEVEIEILRRFQQVTWTRDWREGQWSPVQTLPSAVNFFDGRLVWGGDDQAWLSVSDAYSSFDFEKAGDSAPIQRSVGTGGGGAYSINGILALQRLIFLTDAAEVSARSSSFDEALKPDGITLKDASSQGSARVAPVRVDRSGFYVQANGTRVYRLQFAAEAQDYASSDMCELIPEIGEPGFVKLAVLRQPDTHIFALRSDGTLARLTYYFQDDTRIASWLEWETDGAVKDIVVKPSPKNDELHLLVERTNAGGTYLARERLAQRTFTKGGDSNRLADAFVWSESPTLRTTVTGLGHLNGREVVVWADGKAQPRKTVASGQITLTTAARNVLVGLYYRWRNKSTKLAYSAAGGTALLQPKRVDHLGLLLRQTHINGIKVGRSFDKMDPIPRVVNSQTQTEDTVFEDYDHPAPTHNGNWETDARVCLEGGAPYPVTVLAMVMTVQTADKL